MQELNKNQSSMIDGRINNDRQNILILRVNFLIFSYYFIILLLLLHYVTPPPICSIWMESYRSLRPIRQKFLRIERSQNWRRITGKLVFFSEIDLEEEIEKWILTQYLETWKPNATRRWPLWYNPKFPLYHVVGNPSQAYIMIIVRRHITHFVLKHH